MGNPTKVEIIAHRGASYDAPENTLAAVELAWRQSADAVEIDIQQSSDGEIVLMHDANTSRTTGVSWEVREKALAELRQLDAGSWKGAQWAGQRIPTLGEALLSVPPVKRLLIEIKCGPEVLPALDCALRESALKPRDITLIGFSLETVKRAKAAMPEHEVLWLSALAPSGETTEEADSAEHLIEQARANELDGLDLAATDGVTRATVQKIFEAGLKLYVWTVDSLEVARQMAAMGVNGITTNRPELLADGLRTARPNIT